MLSFEIVIKIDGNGVLMVPIDLEDKLTIKECSLGRNRAIFAAQDGGKRLIEKDV